MGKKHYKRANKGRAANATAAATSTSLFRGHEGSGDILIESGTPTPNETQNERITIVEEQEKKLSRSLSQRHIQMIALAGAVVSSNFL
jgi:amino acid permease